MLLERKDVNLDQPYTFYGRTPLSWVARTGHEGTVKMLLERKDVNPDRIDTEYGRTPLTCTLRGRDGIVKMLLERKNAHPAMLHNVNQTPQSVAPSEGHDEIARIPLERDEANCAAVDLNSPTPLPPTAMHPGESSVEIQFTSHNPNTDITYSSYQPGLISVVHCEQLRLLVLNLGSKRYTARRNETAKRNGAKESHLIRSHTEAGEKLFSSQRQLLAQRHPPTHLFATGQLYRFATLAIVYKVFNLVPGGVALPSGVRCCFAFGRFVLLCPSAPLFCLPFGR